jgi:hypothetical protein
MVKGCLDHLSYRVERGNIASHRERIDFLGERLQFVKRPGNNDHSCATGGEELGGGLANTGACPSYNDRSTY